MRLAVARAKQGDPAAIRHLYITYSDSIYGYIQSIVRDEYEAEDVTQLVFAKLMTHLSAYDERGAPFFAWLLRLARNAAIDQLRASRVVPTANLVDPLSASVSDFDEAEALRLAFAALPEGQRRVVLLRHVVGLTPAEIADRMGRSESSIHGLHHRGRQALRRELERLEAMPCTREPKRLGLPELPLAVHR